MSRLVVNVYVVNHFFTIQDLELLATTLNNSDDGFGKIANFRVQVYNDRYYLEKEPTPSIVVLGKLSKEHIKQVMPPDPTIRAEAKQIHNLSFTFWGLKPPVIVFNANNWKRKPKKFTGTQQDYLTYLINHEFGHALSLRHEHKTSNDCPLMYQQSLGTQDCLHKHLWPSDENIEQARRYLQAY